MSARGWAGVLNEVAREIEIAVDVESGRIQYGAPVFERPDVGRLRELAGLLDRIDPWMARALRTPTDDRTVKGAALAADAEQIIAALARGPAEQQETGR